MRTILSLIAGTAIIGAGLLAAPSLPAQAARQERVVVCHWGDEDNDNVVDAGELHTIKVAAPAVKAHLRHGDTEGACPSPSPTPTP